MKVFRHDLPKLITTWKDQLALDEVLSTKPPTPPCKGERDAGDCLSYDSKTKTWSIEKYRARFNLRRKAKGK
jgi:hypothetical protein